MKADRKIEGDFLEWVKAMTIIQFHAFCGTLWNPKKRDFETWELWPGVRGYPGQREMLMAFSIAKFVWTLKARQLGGSEGAAFHILKTSIAEPRAETLIISKKQADAKYFLKRRVLPQIESAMRLEYEPGKRFPWPTYEDNSDTGKIKFSNGSFIEALSSDNEEARSRSPRIVLFDEIRTYLNKDADELWSAISPTIDTNPVAQGIAISTAKFGSWYNETTKKIMSGSMRGFEFLFMPDDTDPKRTPAWREDVKSRFSHPALFAQEHPLEPSDCFISREGAVFPQFDPRPGGLHVHEFKLNFGWKYMIVYDHGRTHPAVLLLCLFDAYENHLYVFDEVFCRGMELPQVCYAIRQKLNQYKTDGAPDPKLKIADSACFAEDGRRSVASILKELTGIQFTESHKFDIMTSIDRLGSRFSNGLISIHPRCVQTIKQIQELKYKREAGVSKKEEIVDIEDDACFVGNTEIIMAGGTRKAIKDIKKGDMVATHLGYAPASGAVCTGRNKVYELTFSNGRKVQCTGSHPFLTTNGFKNASALVGGKCVKRFTKLSMDVNITKSAQAIGDELMEGVCAGAEKCTRMFGSSITESTIFQNSSYITKTMTRGIIESKTLNCLPSKTISQLTKKIGSYILKKFKTNAAHITAQKLEGNRLAKQPNLCGKSEGRRQFGKHVYTVVKNIKPLRFSAAEKTTDFVRTDADPMPAENLGLTILKSVALCVVQKLQRTNILRLVSVRYPVGQNSTIRLKSLEYIGTKPVYNFSTAHGTYCVEGLVVSNCDCLRYIDAALDASVRPKVKTESLHARLEKQARINLVAKSLKTGNPALLDDVEAAWQAG